MKQLSGAEAVVRALEDRGITVMFGVSGHTNVVLLDAVARSGITYIGVRHEQVAVHAADGYFRFSHQPAAVLTTVGPGLGNTIAALGDATFDSSAVVVIAGDIPTYYTGRGAFQEIDLHGDAEQIALVRPLAKRTWRVVDRGGLEYAIHRAVDYAVTGRPGPVVVSVPMNLLSEPGLGDPPIADGRARRAEPPAPEPASVGRLADELVAAERPLILAGGGAVLAEARAEITALAERLAIPVVTTMSGKGAIAEDHPLAGGFTSTVGTPVAQQLLADADVLLVLGSQLSEIDTSSWDRELFIDPARTRVVQVDVDAAMLGRHYPLALGLQADVRVTVHQLNEELTRRSEQRSSADTPRIAGMRAARDAWLRLLEDAAASDDWPIVVERLLSDIRAVLPRNGLFLTDVGIRQQASQQYPVYEEKTWYVGSGWGTMGGATAAALGARLAHPERPVVAEVGDGAFTSVLSTLITAVEYNLPIVWVVLNNFGFSSISVFQAKHKLEVLGTTFRRGGQPYNPDFAALAAACGAWSRTVERAEDFRQALEEALASGRPAVLDVLIEERPHARSSGRWDVNDIISGERFVRHQQAPALDLEPGADRIPTSVPGGGTNG